MRLRHRERSALLAPLARASLAVALAGSLVACEEDGRLAPGPGMAAQLSQQGDDVVPAPPRPPAAVADPAAPAVDATGSEEPGEPEEPEPVAPGPSPLPSPSDDDGTAAPTPDDTGVTFFEGFDDREEAVGKEDARGRWGAGVQPEEWSLRLVDDPVAQGTRAARFELRASDNSPKADLARPDIADGGTLPYDEDAWIGFSMMIPSGIELRSSRPNILWQIHPKNHATDCGGQPQLSLDVNEGDRYTMSVGSGDPCGGRSDTVDLGPVVRDRYVHFVVNFKNSNSPDDYARVWVLDGEGGDTEPVMDHAGPVGYADAGDYSRIGIYAPGCNQGCRAYDWDAMVLYVDEYREGTSFAAVVPRSAATGDPAEPG